MKRSEILMKPIDRDSEMFWELAQNLLEFADKDSIEKFMSFVLSGFEEAGMLPPEYVHKYEYRGEICEDSINVWEEE